MQTTYDVSIPARIKGMPLTAPRRSVPAQLPLLAQILRLTIPGGAGTSDVTITVVDEESGQSYSITVTGSATEATLLASVLAAVRGNAKLNQLFSVADGGTGADVVVDFTARHANRGYQLSSVGGASGASAAGTVSELQAEGGAGLEMGIIVARGSNDGEFAALGASSTIADILGVLFRTDANHFHSLENDTFDAVDACRRGKHYPISEMIRYWAEAEEAMTPSSRVYVRRATTSGVGTPGDLRASPAGSAQVATVTPTAAELDYVLLVDVTIAGVRQLVPLLAANPDGSNTATETCDALRAAVAQAQTDGLLAGFSTGGTATMTLTGPAGVAFLAQSTGEGLLAVADTTPADVDTIDITSICKVEQSRGADGLVQVSFQLQP